MTDTGNDAQRAGFEKCWERFSQQLMANSFPLSKEIARQIYAAGAADARAGEPVTPLTDVQWDTAPATKRKCGHVTAGQCNQCERCFACCTCCPECNSSRKLQKFNDPNKCRHPHHAARQEKGKVKL